MEYVYWFPCPLRGRIKALIIASTMQGSTILNDPLYSEFPDYHFRITILLPSVKLPDKRLKLIAGIGGLSAASRRRIYLNHLLFSLTARITGAARLPDPLTGSLFFRLVPSEVFQLKFNADGDGKIPPTAFPFGTGKRLAEKRQRLSADMRWVDG